MARLEEWGLRHVESADRYVLMGRVYGHGKLDDGSWMRSGPILFFSPDGTRFATENTIYRLGQVEDGPRWMREELRAAVMYNRARDPEVTAVTWTRSLEEASDGST